VGVRVKRKGEGAMRRRMMTVVAVTGVVIQTRELRVGVGKKEEEEEEGKEEKESQRRTALVGRKVGGK
jgi:hypothetical protein